MKYDLMRIPFSFFVPRCYEHGLETQVVRVKLGPQLPHYFHFATQHNISVPTHLDVKASDTPWSGETLDLQQMQ